MDICFIQVLLFYNLFYFFMLNLEFAIVQKPLVHSREGRGNRTVCRERVVHTCWLTGCRKPACHPTNAIAPRDHDWLLNCVCVHLDMTVLLFIVQW